jgi:hypothetical protein
MNNDYITVTGKSVKPALPSLSAIVVIPDVYETVRTTMAHLRCQTVVGQIEIVFVAPASYRFEPEASDLACFHSWQVVPVDEVRSIAGGFLAGIMKAGAPIVALTEDHSYPAPNWAETFINAHRQPWAAVGPSMRNGNPVNLVSWADFYQAYGEWSHPVKSATMRHLPGHNSSYKRDILLSCGEILEVLMHAESVLHRHLNELGYELRLESGTCTTHLNFERWSDWIPARYYAGRQFAGTWACSWSWIKRLGYALASPGIPWLRLWRTQSLVWKREKFVPGTRLLPVILTGFIVEALGNTAGFISGVGDANRKIADYEYHRIKAER